MCKQSSNFLFIAHFIDFTKLIKYTQSTVFWYSERILRKEHCGIGTDNIARPHITGGQQLPDAMKTNPRLDMSTLSDYYSDNEQPNNLDFNELAKIGKYREAITRLQRRCEYMSQNNERLVRRWVLKRAPGAYRHHSYYLAICSQVTLCETNYYP